MGTSGLGLANPLNDMSEREDNLEADESEWTEIIDEESPTVDPLPEISSISVRFMSMLSSSAPKRAMFSWMR